MSLKGAKIDLIKAEYCSGNFYICMSANNFNSLSDAMELVDKPYRAIATRSLTRISKKDFLEVFKNG